MFASPKKRWKIAVERGGFRKQQKEKKLFDFTFCLFVLEFSFLWPTRNSPQTPPLQQSYYYKRIFMAKSGGGKNQGWEIRAKTKSNWRRKKCFAYIFTGN